LDALTITLMLCAGLLHASWHSLVQSGQNRIAITAGMGAIAGICAVAALPFVPPPPPQEHRATRSNQTDHRGFPDFPCARLW
jgi:hypothetical protein